MLADSNRNSFIDKRFKEDASNVDHKNSLFIRLTALKKNFTKVDFSYSIFETCYLRQCVFDSCDFTGCRFVGTNLHEAKFSGCEFRYAIFERTLIDNYILAEQCPEEENLKMRFARSLRINYQSIGDADSANKAMSVELRATEEHLYKSWHDNTSYYRGKYKGWKRIKAFIEWTQFKLLDFIWGNGESFWKLLRAVLIIFVLMTLINIFVFKVSLNINGFIKSLFEAPQIFMGIFTPTYYPSGYITLILFLRLVAFGFFMSIIIKRFNRR
jgi:hypothetical protein